ncbi:MAG: hypothetical protein EA400_01190 [Chromatiaceae bacterium]|nr:MAG: hypothetical protein EA400_01190 [Chromatiaceae bacterium]
MPAPKQPAAIAPLTVRITSAFPELIDELSRLPPRGRPERLRHLAAIGVQVLRGGFQAALHAPAAGVLAEHNDDATPAPAPAPGDRATATEAGSASARLRQRLLRSAGQEPFVDG